MEGRGHSGYAGTVPELLDAMARGGIAAAAMMNLTPVRDMREALLARLPAPLGPAQRVEEEARIAEELKARLRRRNDWTCAEAARHPTLLPFVGLDPHLMSAGEMRDEIERALAKGARGIKLHPIVQYVPPNHASLWPVYELAQEVGVTVLFHSGAFGPAPGNDFARPSAFREVLLSFPDLSVVLAHLGVGWFDEAVELATAFPGVSFDCCGTVTSAPVPWALTDEEAVGLFRRIGVERICFGSDYPWFDPAADAQRLREMRGLTDGERRAILGENARRLLRLDA
jgi:predicted TIM-barrel fold metal-dependent hydrolase